MADQLNISQVASEIEWTAPPILKVGQVTSEIEWTVAPLLRVSQIFMEVEYEKIAAADTGYVHPIVTILCAIPHITGDFYRRATSYYVSGDGTAYLPGLSFPEYSDELTDTFYGIQESGGVTLEIAMGGQGGFDDYTNNRTWKWIADNHDLRGRYVTLTRYDPELGELSGVNTDYIGMITGYEYNKDSIRITLSSEDDPLLETLLPKTLVTTAFGSNVVDLGRPVNMPLGWCRDVPLALINNDLTSKVYDYLIGHGPIESIWNNEVKRDGVLVNTAEYTLLNNTTYPGYAVLRFVVEQKDFSGQFHNLTASVKGLTWKMPQGMALRGIIENLKRLLTWQIALADPNGVDGFTGSWQAVEAVYPANEWMIGFNIGGEQKKARDWIAEILQYTSIQIYRGYNSQWFLRAEMPQTYSAEFGDNDGFLNNCTIVKSWITPVSEMIKKVQLQYGFSESDKGEVYYELLGAGGAYGIDKTIQLRAVNDFITAKKIISRIINTQMLSYRWVEFTAGAAGKSVKKGEVVRLYDVYPDTYKDYIVHATKKNFSKEYVFTCREYDSTLYADRSFSEPSAPTSAASTVTGPATLVGTYVHADSTEYPIELTANEISGYDIYGIFDGLPTVSEFLLHVQKLLRPITIPANLTGSYFYARVAATAQTVFTIKKNETVIGTATFAAAATTATFSFTSAVSFVTGDTLCILGPATNDTTLADFGWSIVTVRDRA